MELSTELMSEELILDINKAQNILHFDPCLSEYYDDGRICKRMTLIKHLRTEDACLLDTNINPNPELIFKYIVCKCHKIYKKSLSTYCVYKFDNELEIEVELSFIYGIVHALIEVIKLTKGTKLSL